MLLPQTLSEVEVMDCLEPLEADIMSVKSDGQATGIAMKFFKERGAQVDGKIVTGVVKNIRKRGQTENAPA
jgi:hypothetical protein